MATSRPLLNDAVVTTIDDIKTQAKAVMPDYDEKIFDDTITQITTASPGIQPKQIVQAYNTSIAQLNPEPVDTRQIDTMPIPPTQEPTVESTVKETVQPTVIPDNLKQYITSKTQNPFTPEIVDANQEELKKRNDRGLVGAIGDTFGNTAGTMAQIYGKLGSNPYDDARKAKDERNQQELVKDPKEFATQRDAAETLQSLNDPKSTESMLRQSLVLKTLGLTEEEYKKQYGRDISTIAGKDLKSIEPLLEKMTTQAKDVMKAQIDLLREKNDSFKDAQQLKIDQQEADAATLTAQEKANKPPELKETTESKEIAKKNVKDAATAEGAAQQAQSNISTLENMLVAFNDPAITGAMGPSFVLGPLERGWEAVTSPKWQKLQTDIENLVLQNAQSMSGALSNNDILFLKGTAPNLEKNSAEANRMIVTQQLAANKRIAAKASFLNEWYDKYGTYDGGSAAFQTFARENPVFNEKGTVNDANIANYGAYLEKGFSNKKTTEGGTPKQDDKPTETKSQDKPTSKYTVGQIVTYGNGKKIRVLDPNDLSKFEEVK